MNRLGWGGGVLIFLCTHIKIAVENLNVGETILVTDIWLLSLISISSVVSTYTYTDPKLSCLGGVRSLYLLYMPLCWLQNASKTFELNLCTKLKAQATADNNPPMMSQAKWMSSRTVYQEENSLEKFLHVQFKSKTLKLWYCIEETKHDYEALLSITSLFCIIMCCFFVVEVNPYSSLHAKTNACLS